MTIKRYLLTHALVGSLLFFHSPLVIGCDALDSLASPRGAIGLTGLYGFVGGIANFFWAFDWSTYTPVSPETSAMMQMSGGLAAAGASILFGALVPVVIYKYIKKHPQAVAQEAEVQDGDDDDDEGEQGEPGQEQESNGSVIVDVSHSSEDSDSSQNLYGSQNSNNPEGAHNAPNLNQPEGRDSAGSQARGNPDNDEEDSNNDDDDESVV